MAKHYFKNLDGLRFIAALTVAFSHFETLKQYRHIPFLQNRFFEHAAEIAVTFFFVLSGFLIMWWFMEETNGDLKKINIKIFYINRIARTWPLYFLIVFGSLVISIINGSFQHDPLSAKRYIAYLLFLPNTVDVFFKRDIYLGPAWSLAVEECFYLLFPLFLLSISRGKLIKRLFILAALFLLMSILFNRIFLNLFFHNFLQNDIISFLNVFFERYRFYSFLLGSIAASILFYGDTIGTAQRDKFAYQVGGIILALLFFGGTTFSFLTHQLYSLLFAIFLFFIARTNKGTALLDNKVMIWGGKRSYAIYMLHMFIIMRLINQGISIINFQNKVLSIFISWVVYLGAILIAAQLSFRFFENPIRMAVRKRFVPKTMKIGS